jgi:hypothetical protein
VTTSACRGCGKQILWKHTREGKAIPLDPVAPVYQLVTGGLAVKTEYGFYVNHYSTCREAYKPKGQRAWEQPVEPHFSEPKEVV